jgi:hypothetical protein
MAGHKDRVDFAGQPNVPRYDAGSLVDVARFVRLTAGKYVAERATAEDVDRACREWLAVRGAEHV